MGLIVMSSHGRGGVDRWLHGSVAEKVLRRARCPVMLVRATVSSPMTAAEAALMAR